MLISNSFFDIDFVDIWFEKKVSTLYRSIVYLPISYIYLPSQLPIFHLSGQIIVFHQPRFPWNKMSSLP